jgi:NADH-quinone oxidoreductase subunit M
MIVPVYFLIALRGGAGAKPAAMKFFLMTVAGSLLMLVSLVGIYSLNGQHSGSYTFDYFQLLGTPLDPQLSLWLMLGFLAAFAVKVPMLPLHIWAPDAYSEAEPPVAILLAGAMANVGAYGILRFCLPLFPDGAAIFAPIGMALGAVGVVYAGLLALVQDDMRRLIAYSSISHMGLVVLGLFAWQLQSLAGAVYLLLAHGLAVAGLFAVVGVVDDRGRSTVLSTMGGWYRAMPKLGVLFLLFVLTSVGLPGLANFVGEFLVLAGSARVDLVWAAVALTGMVVSVTYFLRMYERSMLGPLRDQAPLADLDLRESVLLGGLVALILWLGLYPASFLDPVTAAASAVADLNSTALGALGSHALR